MARRHLGPGKRTRNLADVTNHLPHGDGGITSAVLADISDTGHEANVITGSSARQRRSEYLWNRQELSGGIARWTNILRHCMRTSEATSDA